MYTPDNYDAFVEHEAYREKSLLRLPVCCICEEHIQQESAFKISGDWYCDECIEEMREDIDEW